MAENSKQILLIKEDLSISRRNLNQINSTVNKCYANANEFKRHRKKDRRFFEHDTRGIKNRPYGRASINLVDEETHWNDIHVETAHSRNVYQRTTIRRKPNQMSTDHTKQNNFTNVNRLRKKLLKKEQKLRKQLLALQTQRNLATLMSSSCCCKCTWLTDSHDGGACNSLKKELKCVKLNDLHRSHAHSANILLDNSMFSMRKLQNVLR